MRLIFYALNSPVIFELAVQMMLGFLHAKFYILVNTARFGGGLTVVAAIYFYNVVAVGDFEFTGGLQCIYGGQRLVSHFCCANGFDEISGHAFNRSFIAQFTRSELGG